VAWKAKPAGTAERAIGTVPNGGEEGPCALQEFEAHNGANGPAPIVTAYTGFAELA
jgi:hypothetical protein